MSLPSSDAAYLRDALKRGISFYHYRARGYQLDAAYDCAASLLASKNTVLTLPTGTGKTVISGMAAALFLREKEGALALYTAPRRTLLSQLHERSRWLNPTCSIRLVGMDSREDYRHLLASFKYARVIFGMPEFIFNRIELGDLPSDQIRRISLCIIDEFDAFLTLRYLARGISVEFHSSLSRLIAVLPSDCHLLLVSATTPEAREPRAQVDIETRIDLTAQAAFRSFLDETLTPNFISVPRRDYRDFIPHARIILVAVEDNYVVELDAAISDEVSLMINWISGTVGFHIDPSYVLPRLGQIRAGNLALTPGGHRSIDGEIGGYLGRLRTNEPSA